MNGVQRIASTLVAAPAEPGDPCRQLITGEPAGSAVHTDVFHGSTSAAVR